MKILFSPSEGKHKGGTFPPLNETSFFIPELYNKRKQIINLYQEYIQSLNSHELSNFFGLKDLEEINYYKTLDLSTQNTDFAISRYDGVAYDYLDFTSLPQSSKNFVFENCIIFSNLFGPIRAKDLLPDYRFKQGVKLDKFVVEKFYKEHFQKPLDEFLKGEFLLDLRAGFYDKFYIPSDSYVTMKFLKNGKIVSHFAKAYRGTVLRDLALLETEIYSVEELEKVKFEGIELIDKVSLRNKIELIYERI